MSVVVGVDAWRRGWVAVVQRLGEPLEVVASDRFADLVASHPDAGVIAVDIPIGLLDCGRKADAEARRFVRKRGSSVFTTPPRAVLEAQDYQSANRIAKERFGKGISRQSYALRQKILEVDALARSDKRIREVHPEVSFAALAGRPLEYAKRAWNGFQERKQLLASAGLELPEVLEGEAGGIPTDDVLDAAVAAWSARRILDGDESSLPDPPELDEQGYRTAIWY